MNVAYRYLDYNPSYSHPGMPMSTPTSFQNFVAPRPPAGIRWPQEQYTPLARFGQDTRRRPQQPDRTRTSFSVRRSYLEPQTTSAPQGNAPSPSVQPPVPFYMPDMFDTAQNYLMGRNQTLTPPTNRFGGIGATGSWDAASPPPMPSRERSRYISPYQRTMQSYYNEPLPALLKWLGIW